MIKFVATKTRSGKKEGKIKTPFCVIHGQRFEMRKRVELSDEFVVLTGLHDPMIRQAVKNSLLENYGITVETRSDDTKPDMSFVKQVEHPFIEKISESE